MTSSRFLHGWAVRGTHPEPTLFARGARVVCCGPLRALFPSRFHPTQALRGGFCGASASVISLRGHLYPFRGLAAPCGILQTMRGARLQRQRQALASTRPAGTHWDERYAAGRIASIPPLDHVRVSRSAARPESEFGTVSVGFLANRCWGRYTYVWVAVQKRSRLRRTPAIASSAMALRPFRPLSEVSPCLLLSAYPFVAALPRSPSRCARCSCSPGPPPPSPGRRDAERATVLTDRCHAVRVCLLRQGR